MPMPCPINIPSKQKLNDANYLTVGLNFNQKITKLFLSLSVHEGILLLQSLPLSFSLRKHEVEVLKHHQKIQSLKNFTEQTKTLNNFKEKKI